MAKGTSTILFLVIGLVIGFLIGWIAFGEITQTGEARAIIENNRIDMNKLRQAEDKSTTEPTPEASIEYENKINNSIPVYVIRVKPGSTTLQCLGPKTNWVDLEEPSTAVDDKITPTLNKQLQSLCKNILDNTGTGTPIDTSGTSIK